MWATNRGAGGTSISAKLQLESGYAASSLLLWVPTSNTIGLDLDAIWNMPRWTNGSTIAGLISSLSVTSSLVSAGHHIDREFMPYIVLGSFRYSEIVAVMVPE